MGGLLQKLKIWWEEADRTQKLVTILGSAFLVLLLAGTFYWASRPHMALAFSSLDSAEVGVVSDEITKLGIPVQYDVEGNVQVPDDKVAEVRAKLAEAGKLPTAGHMGDELAKFSPLDPPSVEQERLKSMMQTQLAEAIESIKGIQKATVNLNFGEQSAFEDEKKPATASVEIALAPNAMLVPDQGRVIAMLVANAVTGLSPDKVFVMDSGGHPLYDGSTGASGDGGENQKLQAQIAETNRRERDLQGALDATFGRGNTLVKVNLELDYDKQSLSSVTHPLNKAVEVLSKRTESMKGGVTPPGGVDNIQNALAPPHTAGTTDNKAYNNTVTQEEHPVDVTKKDEDVAPGALKNMAITVLVNKSKIQTTNDVQTFLDGYLKPWTSDPNTKGNFQATITPTTFDTTAQDLAVLAQASDQSRARMQQLISMLPIAALLFVGFLVARAISKTAKPTMMAALPGGGAMPIGSGGGAEGIGDDHEAGERMRQHEDGRENAISIDDIAPIQERLNLPLEQIKRMSEEKPENVAMLIKSWLLEEHK